MPKVKSRCAFCGATGHSATTCSLKMQSDKERAKEAERRQQQLEREIESKRKK